MPHDPETIRAHEQVWQASETIRLRENIWQASQHDSALYLTKHEVKVLWQNLLADALELGEYRRSFKRIAEAAAEAEAAL